MSVAEVIEHDEYWSKAHQASRSLWPMVTGHLALHHIVRRLSRRAARLNALPAPRIAWAIRKLGKHSAPASAFPATRHHTRCLAMDHPRGTSYFSSGCRRNRSRQRAGPTEETSFSSVTFLLYNKIVTFVQSTENVSYISDVKNSRATMKIFVICLTLCWTCTMQPVTGNNTGFHSFEGQLNFSISFSALQALKSCTARIAQHEHITRLPLWRLSFSRFSYS